MQRLTRKIQGGTDAFGMPMVSTYEDTDLSPSDVVELQKEVIRLAQESVDREKTLANLEAEVAVWARTEKEGRLIILKGSCDSCRFKLQSDSWKYNMYPCSECGRRTKDHYDGDFA